MHDFDYVIVELPMLYGQNYDYSNVVCRTHR